MTEAERSPMRCHLGTLEGNRCLRVHGTVFPLSLTQVIYRKMSETLDRSLTKEASERISWTLQTVPCCFPQLGTRGQMSVLLYFWVSVLLRSHHALLCMTAFHTTKKTDLQSKVRKKNSLQIQYLSTMHNFSQAFFVNRICTKPLITEWTHECWWCIMRSIFNQLHWIHSGRNGYSTWLWESARAHGLWGLYFHKTLG